jgi:hypothetical protein
MVFSACPEDKFFLRVGRRGSEVGAEIHAAGTTRGVLDTCGGICGTVLPARGPGIPGRRAVPSPISKSEATFCSRAKDRCALADSSRVRDDAAAYRGPWLTAHATLAAAGIIIHPNAGRRLRARRNRNGMNYQERFSSGRG